jgi:hypothetical protein
MTDQAHENQQPPTPLGVSSSEGLGAGAETRKPTLATLRRGDMVALYRRGGNSLQRWQVGRCTATRVEVDGKQYTRKGYVVGAPRDVWRGPNEWIEPWDEAKHTAEIARKRAQSRLDKSRATLAAFRWTAVTQAQADAVFATMQSLGMLERLTKS